MMLTIYFVTSFLVGSVPTAFLVAKRSRGIDIRQFGSGNVGATNVFRVLGKKAGTFVFIADVLKGWAPVHLFVKLYPMAGQHKDIALLIGMTAVLGHIFTPFLGFRGGKGIASGAGAILGWFPQVFLISIVIWILTFKVTRVVSISSLVALGGLLASAFFYNISFNEKIILSFMVIVVVWTHRSNIRRLISNKENKI